MKINKKTKIQTVLSIILSIACILASGPVINAVAEDTTKSLEQLRDEYEQIEQEIQQNEAALDEVEEEIQTNEERLDEIHGELEDIQSQIDILDESLELLEGDITALNESVEIINEEIILINEQIATIEIEIEETRDLMEETKEQLLARIRENNMAGDGASLEERALHRGLGAFQ